MAKMGILVDYEWCSGCHACEIACQMELGLEPNQFGVKIEPLGPWHIEGDKWQHLNMPLFSEQCNLCEARTAKGKLPSCVHHCQAKCLTYGSLEELSVELGNKTLQALFALK